MRKAYKKFFTHFLAFSTLRFGAGFSVLAFFTPAFSTVPRFPFSRFQSPSGDVVGLTSILVFCQVRVQQEQHAISCCIVSVSLF